MSPDAREALLAADLVCPHTDADGLAAGALVLRARGGTPWLAAVGAAGDRGRAGLDLPECAGAAITATLKLVPLVNAPRRMAGGPVRTSLELLVERDSPKAALADPRSAELEDCRQTWRAAYDRVVRAAPRCFGDVAVLRFDVPFQVHPLVAQTWARRLAPRPVLAADDGWVPGRVRFSVRGGGPDADLRGALEATA